MLFDRWFKRVEKTKCFLDIYICIRFLLMRRQNFTIKNKKMWWKTIRNCFRTDKNIAYDEWKDWIQGFTSNNLTIVKQCRVPLKKKDPIIVSVVRDEMERLPVFIQYYRKMGIKRFAIIDNNSRDDTINWLIEQRDVDVFSCSDAFTERKKVGWSNRVISFYGVNRWFLLLDGDEFIDWPQRMEYPLSKMVREFEKRNIFQVKALMVDMYARDKDDDNSVLADNFEKAYKNANYFDINSYYEKDTRYGRIMTGGIRKRVFNHEIWLTKYPLFCLHEGEVLLNAHLLYPIPIYKKNSYFLVIRHYKFMIYEDIEKFKKYSEEENFCEKSKDPKAYYRNYKRNKYHFFYEDSYTYSNPKSLESIPYIERFDCI